MGETFKDRKKKDLDALHKKVRSGDTKIVRVGHKYVVSRDLYVNILAMPWPSMLALIGSFYFGVNLVFATLYYLNLDGVSNAHNFADVFFFSVQTMATIGYGYMAPIKTITNLFTTIEALLGFICFAFITSLMFTKFSRPTANVLFSKVAVISNYEGKPHMKFRLANKRTNMIVDATARLFLLRFGVTQEGFPMRRFIDLKVLRDHMPLLRLTWTLMHPIDENSPFYGLSPEEMLQPDDEVFVTIIGTDETMAQTVHASFSYLPEEIIHNAFFEDVVKRTDEAVELNYEKFHSYKRIVVEEQKAAAETAESRNLDREGRTTPA